MRYKYWFKFIIVFSIRISFNYKTTSENTPILVKLANKIKIP